MAEIFIFFTKKKRFTIVISQEIFQHKYIEYTQSRVKLCGSTTSVDVYEAKHKFYCGCYLLLLVLHHFIDLATDDFGLNPIMIHFNHPYKANSVSRCICIHNSYTYFTCVLFTKLECKRNVQKNIFSNILFEHSNSYFSKRKISVGFTRMASLNFKKFTSV